MFVQLGLGDYTEVFENPKFLKIAKCSLYFSTFQKSPCMNCLSPYPMIEVFENPKSLKIAKCSLLLFNFTKKSLYELPIPLPNDCHAYFVSVCGYVLVT